MTKLRRTTVRLSGWLPQTHLQMPRTNPIKPKYTVMYPQLISMYLKDRCSKREMITNIVDAQPTPARSPAPKPHCQFVPLSPRKNARLYEMIHARTSVSEYVFAGLALATCSSLNPLSFCQALKKRTGEYHNAPTTRLSSAHTKTARWLMYGFSIAPQ